MARVEGIDPRRTTFAMRYVFKKVRLMIGCDLTPQKITARVPRCSGCLSSRNGC